MVSKSVINQLNQLSVPLGCKVDWVLVASDFKLGSEMILDYPDYCFGNETRMKSFRKKRLKMIVKFLKSGGYWYKVKDFVRERIVKGINIKYKSPYVFYATNQKDLTMFISCFNKGKSWKRDVDDNLILGRIYGFPIEAVKAYSKNVGDISRTFWPEELEHVDVSELKYGNEPWFVYMSYIARHDKEEDTEVAKKWYQCVRTQAVWLDRRMQKRGVEYHNRFLKRKKT